MKSNKTEAPSVKQASGKGVPAGAAKKTGKPNQPSIFSILGPYRAQITVLVIIALAVSGLTLWTPKLISHAIDDFVRQSVSLNGVAWKLGLVSLGIFILTYLQNVIQTITAEQVARNLRNQLAEKISKSSYAFIQQITSARLLTNLTSDMDGIKTFVSQAVATLISAIVLIIGSSILLLETDWRLGLAVLAIVPIIGYVFASTLGRVRTFFLKGREVIDRLNRVINESILGSALIRVFNTQRLENDKFIATNSDAKELGLSIVKIFAGLFPIITLLANVASLLIVVLGGKFLINGSMTLGDFTAFTTYLTILIYPIFLLGFTSNIIAQATASYGRIAEVLTAPLKKETGEITAQLKGDIATEKLTMAYGEKQALKEISLAIAGGKRTAIIGPTAAGKTQLILSLMGLIEPTSGKIMYDGKPLESYDKNSFHKQVGVVFQDSVVFNLTLRENIAFSEEVSEADLQRAIETAELADFIKGLPQGLDTVVSERGTTLSGGQKQRLMLARALALNPSILLLDDFTARVDTATEKKIIDNLAKNYPNITLVSVTQKIGSIESYDQIILLMEGELLAAGTHKQLMKQSPEYVQIFNSQRSTNTYELHA